MIRERFQKAVEIITKNDRGGFTVPTSKLYPHQWKEERVVESRQ